MDFLIVRTLLVSMAKNKSWYSNFILAVIIRKPKIRRNKFGIYPINTSSYGHIQYEKKLPYGSVFSLPSHDNKKQNMSGRASVVIVVFIHKTDRSIFINQVINLK